MPHLKSTAVSLMVALGLLDFSGSISWGDQQKAFAAPAKPDPVPSLVASRDGAASAGSASRGADSVVMPKPRQLELGLPPIFQKNQGQADPSIHYLIQRPGWGMSLKPAEAVVTLHHRADAAQTSEPGPFVPPPAERWTSSLVNLKFLGARPESLPTGKSALPTSFHYLTGSDPRHWHRNVPGFQQVRYPQIYPGIDLLFHGSGQTVEFDFIVQAGADPEAIRLAFSGAENLELEATGDLRIKTTESSFRLRKPVVYQGQAGSRRLIEGSFVVAHNHEVRFQLGEYDPSQALVIDPEIDASRVIQGNGSESGIGVGTDAQNNVYLVFNSTSTDLPGATNASNNLGDLVVAKLNNDLNLQWLTYIGGSSLDLAQSLSVAADGSATVGGGTVSANFPVFSAIQPTHGGGGYDGFILRLNPNGSGFDYSTFVGGSNFDWVTSVHANPNGTTYFSGTTQSGNLQTTSNAIQKTLGGGTCAGAPCTDALFGALRPGQSSWTCLSYFGGNREEAFTNVVTSDPAGNAYLFGITASPNLFLKNPVQSQVASFDLFLTKFNTGFGVDFSTLFGGTSTEVATGILVGGDGAVYGTGYTFSSNFPITLDAFQTSASGNGDSDGFVTKWNPNGTVIASTRIGGTGSEQLRAPVWTEAGLFVPGLTNSSDYPVTDDSQGGNAIFRSTDRGRTWKRESNGLGGLGGGFLLGRSGSLEVNFFFDRRGATYSSVIDADPYPWRLISAPLASGMVVNDINTSEIILAATNDGVWYKHDFHAEWRRSTGTDANIVVTSLASEPGSSTVYATTHGQGLYKSTDAGLHWTLVNSGLPNGLQLSAVASNGSAVAVGTRDSTRPFFTCSSTGTSCTQSGSGLAAAPITKLLTDPANPNNLFALQPPGTSVDGGLFKGPFTGTAFTPLLRNRAEATSFQAAPPNTLYLGFQTTSGYGVSRSEDGGQTWFDAGLNRNGISSMFRDPFTGTIFAVSESAFSGTGTILHPDLRFIKRSFYNNDNAQLTRNGNDSAAKDSNGNLFTFGTFAGFSGTNVLPAPIPTRTDFGVAVNRQNGAARAEPRIEVTKTASPDVVADGQNIRYTIRVKNLSAAEAREIRLTDYVTGFHHKSAQITPVSWPGECKLERQLGNHLVYCTLDSLPGGAEAIIEVDAVVQDQEPDSYRLFFNKALAYAVFGGILATSHSDQVEITLGKALRVTNLRPNGVLPGGTLVVHGNALQSINSVTLNGVQAPITGNSGSQVFVQVPAGVSGQLNMSLNGTQGSAATLAGVQVGPPKADLAVERVFQALNSAQKRVVYSITITNKGPSDAANVMVNSSVANVAGLSPIEITPPSGASCDSLGKVCTIPAMAAGDSKIIGLVYSYASFSGSTLVNQVTVSSATPDPDPANNAKGVSTNPSGAVPQVSGLSSTSGAPGSNLTISGANLNGGASQIQFLRTGRSEAVNTSTTVSFGTVPAEILSISNTQIVVKVPAGAATGPVTVTTPNSSAVSATSFTISDGSSGTVTNFVPIVLTAAGLNNSFFTTELTLSNRGSTRISLSLTYTAAFGDGGGSANTSLPPGQQYVISNAIEWLRGHGISIPDSGNRGGTLAVKASGFLSPADFTATARTTTAAAGGRAGLAYSGVVTVNALTEPSFIYGLRQNNQDRSNLAVQHAGKAADGDLTLRLTVYSGDPANPVVSALPDITLAPGGFFQYSGILTSNGLTLSNGYVKVQRVSGSAPYYAYGVVNDQANSDGSYIPPVPESASAGATGITIPVVVEANAFKSELTVTNRAGASRTVRLSYVAGAIQAPNATASFTLVLQPQEQRIIGNLVEYLRSQAVAGVGPKGPAFAGALFASVDGGDVNDIFLGVRTSSPGGGGEFGLFYAGVPNGQAFEGDGWLFGLQQDEENRSNVALVNTGEVDANDNTYAIELFDGASGLKVATVPNIVLAAKSWSQIGTILATYAPGVTQGYARVMRTAGRNPSIYYGVINDGGQPGQRTGDGAFVPAAR